MVSKLSVWGHFGKRLQPRGNQPVVPDGLAREEILTSWHHAGCSAACLASCHRALGASQLSFWGPWGLLSVFLEVLGQLVSISMVPGHQNVDILVLVEALKRGASIVKSKFS